MARPVTQWTQPSSCWKLNSTNFKKCTCQMTTSINSEIYTHKPIAIHAFDSKIERVIRGIGPDLLKKLPTNGCLEYSS